MKAMAVHDRSFFDEMDNLLNAWLAIVPSHAHTTSGALRCSK